MVEYFLSSSWAILVILIITNEVTVNKLIIFLCLFSTFTNASAKDLSCREQIEKKFEKKLKWLESEFKREGYPLAVGIGGTQILAPMAGIYIAGPLYLVVGGLALGYTIYDTLTLDNRIDRTRTLNDLIDGDLQANGSKYLETILVEARETKPDATIEDVLVALNKGLDSGELCQGIFKTPRRVRKYIVRNINS